MCRCDLTGFCFLPLVLWRAPCGTSIFILADCAGGPPDGFLLTLVHICTLSPLPVVCIPTTLPRPLRLLVPLRKLLLLVLLSTLLWLDLSLELLRLHCQADCCCCQCSWLRLSHVSHHCWCRVFVVFHMLFLVLCSHSFDDGISDIIVDLIVRIIRNILQ